MQRVSLAFVIAVALIMSERSMVASEPAPSSTRPGRKVPQTAVDPSASPVAAPHAAAARDKAPVTKAVPTSTAAPVKAVPAQPETLEEIVARVRKRLAMEAPRGPKPVTPRPPVVERVRLEWRPSVVWPADLGGEALPAPAADQNRVSLSWDAH